MYKYKTPQTVISSKKIKLLLGSLMINFKKIKLVVFYLFFSIIAVNANEIDCDNQNNIICYFEEAFIFI
mgnify:CR=1 FL=1